MSDMPEILVSSEWLKERLDDGDTIVVDSRPRVAYSYGHLPNSVSLGVDQLIQISEHGAHLAPDGQSASRLLGSLGIDNKKTVVVVGEPMDPSAARVAWTLEYLGQKQTKILDVGISEWQSRGLPLTRSEKASKQTEFSFEPRPDIRIESQALRESIGNVSVLDARTPQEFFAGHIPTSTLIPFTDGIGQRSMFESREYLQKMFAERNLSKDMEIVCYCMHGHRASSLFFQLRIAGFDRVRLYDGSFIDWHSKGLGLE